MAASWRGWRKYVLVISCVLLFAAGGGSWVLRRSLPQLSGEKVTHGIRSEVQIIRDASAIPHIFASSLEDATFALGYAHAQDRMWQMDLNRRFGSGMLSEVFGERALKHDRFFRALGIRRAAEQNLRNLRPETQRLLEAYARGVNALLSDDSYARPPEFVAFGIEPRPWVPVDSLVWLKVMAWELGGNWGRELARVRLGQKLQQQRVAEFFAPYPGEEPQTWNFQRDLHGNIGHAADSLLAIAGLEERAGVGSNNWAVDGTRSKSGKPLLANDPHLRLSTPSFWYLAHLNAPGLNVIGATLPGIPAVILGRNDRVAWSFTNTEADAQDLFVEKLAEGNSNEYVTPDGPRAFEQVSERIAVKGRADEVLKIRVSRHGPVISDIDEKAGSVVSRGHVLSLSWTALAADDQTLEFPLSAAQARTGAEVLQATRYLHAPQLNVVYADMEGTIGFVAAGRLPRRKPSNDVNGLVPNAGWLAAYDWDGYVPFEELPQSYRPASGRLVTANQKVTEPGYAHWITSEWAPPYRADRIARLLGERGPHSVETFSAIQMDVESGTARRLLPLLLKVPGLEGPPGRLRALLEKWDMTMNKEGAEPLIFAAWLRELGRLVYEDDLAEHFDDFWAERPEFMFNVLSNLRGQAVWCDDSRTKPQESCDDQARAALVRAASYLTDRFGEEPSSWAWGGAHPARSRHSAFSDIPLLSMLFDVVVPSAGDNQTVNVGGYSFSGSSPFTNRNAAGFRAVYDLAQPERSVFVISTGQSGHFLSRHYKDLSEPWAEGRYVPMRTRRQDVGSDGVGVLTLWPR